MPASRGPLKTARWLTMLVLAALLAPPAAGQQPASWFNLSPACGQHWQLHPDPKDENTLVLAPRVAAAPGREIFVLFPKASPAYDIALNTILGAFQSKAVGARFTLVNFQDDRARGLRALARAEEQNCDLLFSMGSQSTQFVFEHYSGGRLPVVSVCSKDPVLLGQMKDYETGSGSNIAFTSLDAPVDLQLAYLKRLKKNLRNLAIMYARDNVSAVETQVKPMAALAGKEGITLHRVIVEEQDRSRRELEEKVPQAVRAMAATDPDKQNSVFWITGSTAVFQEIETIDRLAAGIPVLSVVPDIVREGEASAVLSIGVSFENNALKAALYAFEILERKARPGDLQVGTVSPPDIAINFRKARQIGLAIPFSFFESASTIHDYEGRVVRFKGKQAAAD